MEKETLEYREKRAEELLKAAENVFTISRENYKARRGFIEGAEWQAERMYSEDEVLELLIKCVDILGESNLSEKDSDKKVVEFFNRYKKK